MTVRWTVRAANDRSRDRTARVKSRHLDQKSVFPLWEARIFYAIFFG